MITGDYLKNVPLPHVRKRLDSLNSLKKRDVSVSVDPDTDSEIEETSWAKFTIEDGEPYWDSAGGKWYSPGKFEAIREGFDLDIICEEEPEIARLLVSTKGTDKVFDVTLKGVDWHYDEPGWDLDYGFDIGAYWIEYESVSIEEKE